MVRSQGQTYRKCGSKESVTSIRTLQFPKIEIKRKPQRNFHSDFIKLVLKHKGGSIEGRKVLRTGSSADSAWLGTGWGQSGLGQKAGVF